MMKTTYACTWVEKLASDWHPTEGASIESNCVMNHRCNITAGTLPALLAAIEKRYFVKLDDLFIPGDEGEDVEIIGTNQVETADCNEPSDDETAQWEAGDLNLYLCDYSFGIEKRVEATISLSEFDLAGIAHH